MDQDVSHRRFNPLTNSWILCSPHRAKRPWLGQLEKISTENTLQYDPNCYLCPGNKRASSVNMNPNYTETFVFTNDFSALLSSDESQSFSVKNEETNQKTNNIEEELMKIEPVTGKCKVICFSPKHNVTLPQMKIEEIVKVVETWQKEFLSISSDSNIQYVQIFENKGSTMGCSNPHPHCQIWATSFIPQEPALELSSFENYHSKHSNDSQSLKCLLCDYITLEKKKGNRIVYENEEFLVIVPYWAVWPYETILVGKSHLQNITQLSPLHSNLLADAIKVITTKYDNLFETSFPYSMGIHQYISQDNDSQKGISTTHMHFHFYPPLLRSATVKKFMVGFELLAEPQRDITPEQSAFNLRSISSTSHYLDPK